MIYLKPKADLILDVARFRSFATQASEQADPALRSGLLEAAVQLYRGDFMSGFSLKDGADFNEWMLTESDALRREFVSALDLLVQNYQAFGQIHSAIPYAQRLVALDAMNEPAHRQLMQLYALADQHTAAIKHYQALEKLLRKELNLDPQPETRELYKKIRRGDVKTALSEKKRAGPEKALPKHNLPLPLTTFIGREKEREEVCKLIVRNRLVTLIGAGGIGKTRLALEAGRTLLDHFSDGVGFVPLESLSDEELVPQALASALGIGEVAGQSMVAKLTDHLRDRNLLLILDNCEHLLVACADIVEILLQRCPNLRVLATSREVMRLEGEAFYQVQSLTLPLDPGILSVEELIKYESVRLFAERAALVASRFEVTPENAGAVVSICNRLGGIPLAIELAAARVDMLSVEEILKQLSRSFDLLVRSSRSTIPRHQTMQTSIDWSWKLLEEPERIFMRRLSVFMGGWTLPAAQAISGSNSLELTSALIKKSFIVAQHSGRETRYGWHEVIRSYAREKLIQAGEEPATRDRHLRYLLELVHGLQPGLSGADQELWLERLFAERDNLRAALEWAARTDVNAGLMLSDRLRKFWEDSDFHEEARWLLRI
jgi:predicted ATPase